MNYWSPLFTETYMEDFDDNYSKPFLEMDDADKYMVATMTFHVLDITEITRVALKIYLDKIQVEVKYGLREYPKDMNGAFSGMLNLAGKLQSDLIDSNFHDMDIIQRLLNDPNRIQKMEKCAIEAEGDLDTFDELIRNAHTSGSVF